MRIKIEGRAELMNTRRWSISDRAPLSRQGDYMHEISWVPRHNTRLILQKIVRSTKIAGGATTRGYYWEMWEVYQRSVYPFKLFGEPIPLGATGGTFYIPRVCGTGDELRGNIKFAVPNDRSALGLPFIHVSRTFGQRGNALRGHGAVDQANVYHDVFDAGAAGGVTGTFKIYGEVYELTEPECWAQRSWLNKFQVFHPPIQGFTAGILPLLPGSSHKPLAVPTLIRYEAGSFRGTATTMRMEEREFPASARNVTYPPARAHWHELPVARRV